MKNAFALVLSIGLICAGCGSRSSAPASVLASNPTTLVAFGAGPDLTSTTTVGVRLDVKSFIDPEYGFVLGYFKGKLATRTQVISVSPGKNIKFVNVDNNDAHTASFLGKATGEKAPWPAHFNGSMTQSPKGTAIGTKNFSTGTLNPGQTSLVYSTGLPGFYMIGCAFHYDSNKMRTVIIVE
jgi:plastocyanin